MEDFDETLKSAPFAARSIRFSFLMMALTIRNASLDVADRSREGYFLIAVDCSFLGGDIKVSLKVSKTVYMVVKGNVLEHHLIKNGLKTNFHLRKDAYGLDAL